MWKTNKQNQTLLKSKMWNIFVERWSTNKNHWTTKYNFLDCTAYNCVTSTFYQKLCHTLCVFGTRKQLKWLIWLYKIDFFTSKLFTYYVILISVQFKLADFNSSVLKIHLISLLIGLINEGYPFFVYSLAKSAYLINCNETLIYCHLTVIPSIDYVLLNLRLPKKKPPRE